MRLLIDIGSGVEQGAGAFEAVLPGRIDQRSQAAAIGGTGAAGIDCGGSLIALIVSGIDLQTAPALFVGFVFLELLLQAYLDIEFGVPCIRPGNGGDVGAVLDQ